MSEKVAVIAPLPLIGCPMPPSGSISQPLLRDLCQGLFTHHRDFQAMIITPFEKKKLTADEIRWVMREAVVRAHYGSCALPEILNLRPTEVEATMQFLRQHDLLPRRPGTTSR